MAGPGPKYAADKASKLSRFADDPFALKLNTPIGQVKGLQTRPVNNRRSFGDRVRTSLNRAGKYLNSDQFSEGIANVAPYVSNIVGAFRQAPNVPTPVNEDLMTSSGVNYGAARSNIDRAVVAADRAAGRYLTGQAAGAVSAANLATKLDAYSGVAMQEANENAQIRNSVAAQNQQVTARNVARANQYNEDVLARNIAMARERSENLANFSDKVVQDNARRDMMKLDKEKFDILSRMYSSGILDRNLQGINAPGTRTPIGKKANGGYLDNRRSLKLVR